MVGVIACAGKSTRLMPCTNFLSKQLLPLFDKPLIYYPISMLMEVGIKDIAIVVNEENLELYKKMTIFVVRINQSRHESRRSQSEI